MPQSGGFISWRSASWISPGTDGGVSVRNLCTPVICAHARYGFLRLFRGDQSPGIGEAIFAAEVVSKGRKFKSLLSIFATPEMHF